jgi:AGZA family xanthine/uracil permease-like MFS transporter
VWASALAALIDRRLSRAAAFFFVAAICTLFGVMHSPLPGSPLFLPWQLAEESQRFVYQFALGYLLTAGMLMVWGLLNKQPAEDEAWSPLEP